MLYWLCLFLAILSEVIGTLSMKYASVTGSPWGHILMYFMITCSYFLLSKAIQKIALGIAYALWEGIGVLFITTFSVIWFDESITVLKVAGLATLLLGILLLKSGTKPPVKKQGEQHATA